MSTSTNTCPFCRAAYPLRNGLLEHLPHCHRRPRHLEAPALSEQPPAYAVENQTRRYLVKQRTLQPTQQRLPAKQHDQQRRHPPVEQRYPHPSQLPGRQGLLSSSPRHPYRPIGYFNIYERQQRTPLYPQNSVYQNHGLYGRQQQPPFPQYRNQDALGRRDQAPSYGCGYQVPPSQQPAHIDSDDSDDFGPPSRGFNQDNQNHDEDRQTGVDFYTEYIGNSHQHNQDFYAQDDQIHQDFHTEDYWDSDQNDPDLDDYDDDDDYDDEAYSDDDSDY